MADEKKVFTHGDAIILIDPTGERKFPRTFMILGIEDKAYLVTKQGTVFSSRSVPYKDNELTLAGLKKLIGPKWEFTTIGIMPQVYGIMTESTRERLTDGTYSIEVFQDGEWGYKDSVVAFEDDLTYRGVRKKCRMCGHLG